MKVTQDVLQRDGRSDTQATGGKHTLQGRVSSGGSPGCAQIVDKEFNNDIGPHGDKYEKTMCLNDACCGASQWGNVIDCDNIASRNDAGHKECAGGQGKAHRDSGLGNPGHQFSGGMIFSRCVDEIKSDTGGSRQLVVGEHTCISDEKVYPEDQEKLGLFNKDIELINSYGLDSLLGEKHVGSMPSHEIAQVSSITSKFGFIPLSANHTVHGPVSDASPDILWGKRDCAATEKYYNFNTYRIPVKSGFNVNKFRDMAGEYWDNQLFDLITFGFPLDVGVDFQPSNHKINHASANNYPNQVNKYIEKEIAAGALHPVDHTKFTFYHTSPLMSRPKEGNNRRIILDLSWPKDIGSSINSCVPVDTYLDSKFILKLPTVETICNIINSYLVPVVLFKVDLARAFRQMPLDPLDVAYEGIHWQGIHYVDTTVPFGWRHGSAACQRITDAIRHIL
jgi:hypothetical protein